MAQNECQLLLGDAIVDTIGKRLERIALKASKMVNATSEILEIINDDVKKAIRDLEDITNRSDKFQKAFDGFAQIFETLFRMDDSIEHTKKLLAIGDTRQKDELKVLYEIIDNCVMRLTANMRSTEWHAKNIVNTFKKVMEKVCNSEAQQIDESKLQYDINFYVRKAKVPLKQSICLCEETAVKIQNYKRENSVYFFLDQLIQYAIVLGVAIAAYLAKRTIGLELFAVIGMALFILLKTAWWCHTRRSITRFEQEIGKVRQKKLKPLEGQFDKLLKTFLDETDHVPPCTSTERYGSSPPTNSSVIEKL